MDQSQLKLLGLPLLVWIPLLPLLGALINLTIGKRLSSRAMLSFEQSISGTSSVVKLTYQLTRRISVIGRAGSENALDALFSISFK